MIRAIIISPSPTTIRQLEASLAGTGEPIELSKEYSRYPTSEELARVITGLAANVVFLDLDNATAAARILEAIGHLPTHPALVAIDSSTAGIVEAMRHGIRDYLIAPFDQPMVNSCVKLLLGILDPKNGFQPAESGTKIISFMPAKPGAGASTIALNTCAAMAMRQRALLVDADPFNGQLAFMLKQDNSFSVRHALERAGQAPTKTSGTRWSAPSASSTSSPARTTSAPTPLKPPRSAASWTSPAPTTTWSPAIFPARSTKPPSSSSSKAPRSSSSPRRMSHPCDWPTASFTCSTASAAPR